MIQIYFIIQLVRKNIIQVNKHAVKSNINFDGITKTGHGKVIFMSRKSRSKHKKLKII